MFDNQVLERGPPKEEKSVKNPPRGGRGQENGGRSRGPWGGEGALGYFQKNGVRNRICRNENAREEEGWEKSREGFILKERGKLPEGRRHYDELLGEREKKYELRSITQNVEGGKDFT